MALLIHEVLRLLERVHNLQTWTFLRPYEKCLVDDTSVLVRKLNLRRRYQMVRR